MQWFDHSKLKGSHAILSPSSIAWVNYSEDKLKQWYTAKMAMQRGTELHEIAESLISHGIVLPENGQTLSMYVNDSIGYDMTPEVILYYSDLCFGTADAISYRNNTLRIHDLKTGEHPASILQLRIYAALFCLEYKKDPIVTHIVLRIYQNNNYIEEVPSGSDIKHIMDVIEASSRVLTEFQENKK